MKGYKIKLTGKAKKDLESLERDIQRRIVRKLRFYLENSNPLQYARKIKDRRFGEYRFRIGDYRIIFDINKNGNIVVLIIFRLKYRKEVYK